MCALSLHQVGHFFYVGREFGRLSDLGLHRYLGAVQGMGTLQLGDFLQTLWLQGVAEDFAVACLVDFIYFYGDEMIKNDAKFSYLKGI